MRKMGWIGMTLLVAVLIGAYQQVGASETLVGVFDAPDNESLKILMDAGVNAVIIPPKATEISRTTSLPIKKIGNLGFNLRLLGTVSHDAAEVQGTVDSNMAKFDKYYPNRGLYGYHVAGDFIRSMKPYTDPVVQKYGLSLDDTPLAFFTLMDIANVTKKQLLALAAYVGSSGHVMSYHYPALRRNNGLNKMLEAQVLVANQMHSTGVGAYVHYQAHLQDWYWEAKRLMEGLACAPELYPDGQVVRMNAYYALATGSDGWFAYNGRNSLDWSAGRERNLAIAQTLQETRPLRDLLALEPRIGQYIEIEGLKLFGSILSGSSFDVLFLFSSDKTTVYHHPSTIGMPKALCQLVDPVARGYQQLYEYTPFGLVARSAGDVVSLAQEKPLILIGVKGQLDPAPFALSSDELVKYLETLKARAATLKENVQRFYPTALPELPVAIGDLPVDCQLYLDYIAQLDELKRAHWLSRSPQLPTNGQLLKNAYRDGLLTQEMLQGQILNFYW